MTNRYGGHHTIPDRTYADSVREKAQRLAWKKSPLLIENPNKNFEVFINDQKLIDGQIVIQGDSYSFVTKDLSGEELRRSNKRFKDLGPENLEFEEANVLKRFKVNVIKEEYFNHSQKVEEILEIFIGERPEWNPLLFSQFKSELKNTAQVEDVPMSYCEGAEEFLFGLHEYDLSKISFSDKLLVANFKLLPWTAMSKFAWNVVSYVHFIRNQWDFIDEISMGEKTYCTQAVHFFSEKHEQVEKNYDNDEGSYCNIDVQPNLLVKSDLIVIEAIALLYSKTKNTEAILEKINLLEHLPSEQKNLSYSQSKQRELLLAARVFRKFNNREKASQKYDQLRSELHSQPDDRKDWVEETERFLSRR
jgi:hypothetical protein